MSARQYAFLIAVLLVWVAADTGWVVIGAIAAGLVALGIVHVVDSDTDLDELVDRFRSNRRHSDRSPYDRR